MAKQDPIFATRTTTRLLDALRDPGNEPVWNHIDARYRAVLAGLARRMGLRDAEADDVAQQTLAEFVRAFRDGRYDRTKGRLSSWIMGIAHHTALRVLRDSRREMPAGATAMMGVPDEHHLHQIWIEERDRAILERAMTMLRDEAAVDDRTLLAFELFGLRGVPVGEVAERCSMTTDQVYVAKSRITKKLRHAVEELTSAFEEDI